MGEEINLNSIIYNEQITREDILSKVSQEDIYTYYIGESMTSGVKIHSPLRDDNVPSFAIFYHKSNNGVLMFYDFATKDCGDCFVFVGKLFGLGLRDTLLKLAFDFGISNVEISADKKVLLNTAKIVTKEEVQLGIKSRGWKLRDKAYWSDYNIIKATLIKFSVTPIDYVFFNGDAYKTDDIAYAYIEYKDGKISYKIYQPCSIKFKWINNANYTVHQGYMQLPQNGNLLVITKSLKDVMSIHDTVNISSVGLQSESVMMKQSVMDEYKYRFKKVICLFDNDKAGRKLSEDFTKQYNVPHFFMEESKGVTDFSDSVKHVGVKETKEEFMTKIKKEINET